MSKIYLIGLNHCTASVEVREKFALSDFTSPEKWIFTKKTPTNVCLAAQEYKNVDTHSNTSNLSQNNVPVIEVDESLILSTCNRVELLVIYDGDPEDLMQVWCTTRCQELNELRPFIYIYEGKEATRHLFRVASSLDSLVLGEPQILGQLKLAYRLSVEAGHTGLFINRLLHRAFSVAKRVRTETGVASSAVSISYAAVELAKQIFDDMAQHDALLLGAGEMAELAAIHLKKSGIRRLRIANRTYTRAEELSERIGGEALAFESLFDCLIDTDIVISSTGSKEPIIQAELMQEVMKKRKNRPMFFIDIAMPRDIDPMVNNIDNVYVYDIDDLKEVVEDNIAQRKEEALKAIAIVEEESMAFELWHGSLGMKPTILDIVHKGDEIMHIELQRALKKLHRIGITEDRLQEILEGMAKAIVHKCHHAPLHYLQSSYKQNTDLQHIATVRNILDLDS